MTRSIRQAVFTSVSVTKSSGRRIVPLCALCLSKISNTGLGVSAAYGMKCLDSQSKKICSSTHREGLVSNHVSRNEFLPTQAFHRSVPTCNKSKVRRWKTGDNYLLSAGTSTYQFRRHLFSFDRVRYDHVHCRALHNNGTFLTIIGKTRFINVEYIWHTMSITFLRR